MDGLPYLVLDSKLTSTFSNGFTVHSYIEADYTARAVRRDECWQQQKFIGAGDFGSVWQERCKHGKRDAELRAVKQIKVPPAWMSNKTYTRELEIIAKFSHSKVQFTRFIVLDTS